jgi:hypothetical protein
MNQAPSSPPRRRLAVRAAGAIALATTLAVSIAACGSSAPASIAPLPSVAVPSVALPSIALPSIALPSIALPSTNPAASGGTAGVDPAAGLTIDPPYTLTAVPGALQSALEAQMAAGLGAFGDAIKVGFRQVGGGTTAGTILMVMAFPSGTLTAAGYQAALGGMTSSMGATFKTTTVDGVDVSAGKASTGGIGVFHIGDHMLVIISPSDAEVLPIATALINANQ